MSKRPFTVFALATVVALSSAAQAPSRIGADVAKSIFHNLHQLAAGVEQYYLENRKSEVTSAQLVGPGKIIGRLPVIAGEDYRSVILKQGIPVVLRLPSGETIAADPQNSAGCTFAFHKVHRDDTAASIASSMHLTVEQLRALNPGVDLAQLQPSDAVRVR